MVNDEYKISTYTHREKAKRNKWMHIRIQIPSDVMTRHQLSGS